MKYTKPKSNTHTTKQTQTTTSRRTKTKRRVFGYRSTLKAKEYKKANVRKHRNKIPQFLLNHQPKEYAYTAWFFLQRFKKHNFNKNAYLNALRLANYQRETIRLDRCEVLSVLVPTLIAYCDFSPANDYLFEVRANVEHLAQMCNQSYLYWDKKEGKRRTRYDTVRKALLMLEDAGLITVLRQFDKKGRKHKPMRIWLNVEFFLMFNVTEQQLKKLLIRFHKYQFINNRLGENFKAYQRHLEKLEHKGVADIKQNHSLRNLLIKRRKDLFGERVIQFLAQRKPPHYLEMEIETDIRKPCFRSIEECNSPEEVHRLRKRLHQRDELRRRARSQPANDVAYLNAVLASYIA